MVLLLIEINPHGFFYNWQNSLSLDLKPRYLSLILSTYIKIFHFRIISPYRFHDENTSAFKFE